MDVSQTKGVTTEAAVLSSGLTHYTGESLSWNWPLSNYYNSRKLGDKSLRPVRTTQANTVTVEAGDRAKHLIIALNRNTLLRMAALSVWARS